MRRTCSSTSSTTRRARRRGRPFHNSLFFRRPVSQSSSRGWCLAALLFATAALTACEIGTVNIPKTTPTIVVHSVLNPLAGEQIVLVERTLTGAVNIPDTNYNAAEPILTAGAVQATGRTVQITDANGAVFRGVEDRSVSAGGT